MTTPLFTADRVIAGSRDTLYGFNATDVRSLCWGWPAVTADIVFIGTVAQNIPGTVIALGFDGLLTAWPVR